MHACAAILAEIMPRMRWPRALATFVVLSFGLLLWAEEADARVEARYADAARAVEFNRLAVEAREEEISPCNIQPAYPVGSLGGLFCRPGLIGGFAAGFLGAGVLGLLFGHGFIGELSGLPSILGLSLQFALLFTLGWLIWAWWRPDKAAAMAELSPRQLADAYERSRNETMLDINTDAAGREEQLAGKEHSRL